jgi:hypothetical protein
MSYNQSGLFVWQPFPQVLWSMIKVLKAYVDEQEPFPSDLPQDLPS